ncbi:MAG: calcium-translocating P-type ATPase, PMCA-type [Cyclobacteriaceae bacterium]|nr:calcium-translocating P-type ATPase, PMCA-type [Cyclobacteriaceae bacterium]
MEYKFTGLTDSQVESSRKEFGSNELSPYKVEGFWKKLKGNFKDPIIIILTVALVIIFVLSLFELTEWYEAVAIAVAVALATLVATFSEFKNEASFQKLQEEASQIKNMVFRNNQLIQISVSEIVKGEYVFLQAGDKLPADGKLIAGTLKLNQSSLTGESDSVSKIAADIDFMPSYTDFSEVHSLFRGSVVDEGEGVMLVDMVGDQTIYGSLARELSVSDNRLSPLQVKLANLASLISRWGYIAASFVALSYIFNTAFVKNNFEADKILAYFSDIEVFLPDILNAMVFSIIIVVAAIPEGLPMMIAIVLSLNMRKLLMEKVLVRRLLGIETAGSLNILFSDKTGTITKGKLEAFSFISGDVNRYNGYSEIPEKIKNLLTISILENSSSFISEEGEITGGNISERALVAFIDKNSLHDFLQLDFLHERKILFNSLRKFSATQIKENSSSGILNHTSHTMVKGAPEIILENCTAYFNEKGEKVQTDSFDKLITYSDEMADHGIRLIALAISEKPIKKDESLPEDCTLLGVVCIRDEIREESKTSIEAVQNAGIQVVMITGDRVGTATAIAKEVGLVTKDTDRILVSSELNQSTDEEIEKILSDIKVIARALPTDKSRLVRISKKLGKVVGMTGDGVNDSAALKQADVGIAMGSGSEVSKEAGDIVILDDNFNSISNAIRYGRTIFKSIRKFIVFQLTVNVAAVLTVLFGTLFFDTVPLTIIQILWINIIMDTLAAIAFGGEPALRRYMNEPPINRDDNILTKDMVSSIFTSGLFIMAFSMFFLSYDPIKTLFIRDGLPSEAVFLTAFFNIFIFMIMFNGFNVRTDKINLFDHIKENSSFLQVMAIIIGLQVSFTYLGGKILRTTALNLNDWMYVLAFSLMIIPVDIIRKKIYRKYFVS